MGKHSKKNLISELHEIEQATKDIQKQRRKIMIKCSHHNHNGKLKIESIDDEGTYRCKICKAVFNMNPIKKEDLEEAVEIVHNALQQIRCHAANSSDAEEKIVKLMGELDFNLQESVEIYDRIVRIYMKGEGKNKDKKKRYDDDASFGRWGGQPISFLGVGKKK